MSSGRERKEAEVRSGKDGVTIVAVARAAGRSISTVSAALNGAPGVAPQTRQDILRVAAELGYRPNPRARLMRASHTGLIGVSYRPGQAFQAELVDALYRAAESCGHGLDLTASTPRHGEIDGIRALVRNRCEAIIVVDPRVAPGELLAAAEGVPLLLMCREPCAGADAVRSQDEVALTRLVDEIVMTGRHDVVYVDGGEAPSTQLRARAFRAAMRAHGLKAQVMNGGETEEAGIRAVCDLAEGPGLPQAMLFYNDHAALGGLLELRRRGVHIPERVALAGFDGIAASALSAVGLTTVCQDVDVIAEVSVRHLIGRLGCQDGGVQMPTGLDVHRAQSAGGGVVYTVPARVIRRTTTQG
nr:LacI family DNA-binding transcriptional regulator [Cutibacterium avidum]